MADKYLVVVDMQVDFVSGSLGTREAASIVTRAAAKAAHFDGTVIFTQDTHEKDYLTTQEGHLLPVVHCLRGSDGWRLVPQLEAVRVARQSEVYLKTTFGSTALAESLLVRHCQNLIDSVELIGLCTDICVVSNALLIKAFLPEVPVIVDASCCAGVTPESHDAALRTMRSCQVRVTGV